VPHRSLRCLSDSLRIAVLGDVHGHLTLALRVLRRWQDETGHELDLILQVGDLGAFPPPFRLDAATRRFAERDSDELGFATYHANEGEAAEVYGPDALPHRALAAELWFIKGNHEDFEFLEEAAREGGDEPVPVAAFGAIRFMRQGAVYMFERRGRAIRIAGLGGIADGGRPGRDPASEHYTASELRGLKSAEFDLLLSHEPPFGAAAAIHPKYASGGSPEVAELLRLQRPRLHFCGHYHEPGQALDAVDGVRSYQLNAVNFLRADQLNPGCIAIVTWSRPDEDAGVELLDSPWLRAYTRRTWRHV
jgi:hypothetical protein